MIDTIVQTIVWLAHESYDSNKDLYHNDFKIALYSTYMLVVLGIGEELRKEGK